MKKIIFALLLLFLLDAKEQVVKIKVEGMTCPLCTMTIKKNLKKQNGVVKAKVKLNTEIATVKFDDNNITKEQLLKAIEEVGYKGKFIPNNESFKNK
jgi:mercuric ion binding protein